MRRWLAGAFCSAALITSVSCDGPGPDSDDGPADVLIITIDTARADHFSHAGLSPVATPVVDAVGREGAVFLQAVSHVPVTLPAHTTLFTGLLPPRHGVRSNGTFRLASEHTTLAELLKRRGYATGAFVGASVLGARYGLDQGFDVYDDAMDASESRRHRGYPRRRAESVVASALDWLGGLEGTPAFAWVHLFDPHEPYDPPAPERQRHPDAPYRGEIAYVDRAIGDLLEGYRRLGRYEEALVIVTSDHGESLGEHGEATHAVFVYDATLRVPLVLRGPGIEAGTRIENQVGLVDLLPTVLSLLGLEIPPGLDGTPLLPLPERPERAGEGSEYVESLYPRLHHGWAEYRGLRTTRWKLIVGAVGELYDLSRDPRELHDLSAEQPAEVARLTALLDQVLPDPGEEHHALVDLPEEERRNLEALGYLWSTGPGAEETGEDLPDPRERIHVLVELDHAMQRAGRGDIAEAIELLEAIVAEEPRAALFRKKLGDLYVSARRFEDALAAYDASLALWPADADALVARGFILHQLSRFDEALGAYESALGVDPRHRKARHNRWGLMLLNGRTAEVESEARAALEQDPLDVEAIWASARVHLSGGRPEQARRELERGIGLFPGDPTLLVELGMIAETRGDIPTARRLYERAAQRDESGFASARLRRLVAAGR